MKQVTDNFKNDIKTYGRQFNFKVQMNDIDVSEDDINYIKPSFNSKLFQTIMHKLEIDSKNEIPSKTKIKVSAGVKLNNPDYEYISYNTYEVNSCKRQEDTNSYISLAYDKMVESMIDYDLSITEKITLRDYLIKICERLGWNTNNIPATFINSNKLVSPVLHEGVKYTFRNALDEIATISCSFLLFKGEDFYLVYPTDTNQNIDNEYLNEDNVTIEEKYFINSLVFSRAEESDNIYRNDATNIELNGLHEYRISDNQLLSTNDRDLYIDEMWEYLKTFEFYIFDVSSKGILFLEACDRFNFVLSGNTYSTILLNNEIAFEDGLTEELYIDKPEETETDYKYADTTDKRINKAYLLVDKQNQTIQAVIEETNELQSQVTDITTTQATLEGTEIKIDDGAEEPIIKLEVDGASRQATRSGKNILDINSKEITKTNTTLKYNNNSLIVTSLETATACRVNIPVNYKLNTPLTISFDATMLQGYDLDDNAPIVYFRSGTTNKGKIAITKDSQKHSYSTTIEEGISETGYDFWLYVKPSVIEGVVSVQFDNIQIEENAVATEYEPYGAMPSPEFPSEIQSVGDDVNLFDINEVTYRGGDTDVVIENNKIILTATGTVGAQMAQKFIHNLNANENYTFSFKAKKTTLGTDGYPYISVSIYGSNDEINYTTLGNTGSLNKSPKKDTEYYFSRTVTGYTSYRFYIYNNNSTPVTVGEQTEYYDIKLQKGTVATAYSEYGKGTVEIKQSGKNLLENIATAITVNGITFTVNDDGTVIANGTATDTAILFLQEYPYAIKAGNYSLSGCASDGSTSTYKLDILNNTGNVLVYDIGNGANFVLTEDLISRGVRIVIYKGVSANNLVFKPMISVEGGKYESYKSNNHVIPLSQSLRSLPNGVCDTIEEDGIHRRVGSVVLDGSQPVNYSNYEGLFWIGINNLGISYKLEYGLSTHFKNIPDKSIADNAKANTVLNDGEFAFRSGDNKDRIYFKHLASGTDLNNFKSFLAEQYANGTPATVDYELAEEVIEPFDEEQQAVIDSISTMLDTQYFTCDANMRITYVRNNGLSDMYETKNNAIKKYAHQEMKLTETGALIESLVSVTNALNDGFKVGDEELQKKLEELGKSLEDYQLTTSTSFEQTEANFQMKFNELIESINTNAEGNSEKFAEIVKYIRFEDGNIVLGRSDNQLILKIQNDRISYQQNGTEVAYFSNNKLYVRIIQVIELLGIGDFALVIEENRSLSLEIGGTN